MQDLTANQTLMDTQYLYTSQSSKDWYLGSGASNQVWNQPYYAMASDRWVFRPWKQVSVPLSGLGGHQVNIRFEVRDCNYGAHAIYGYLDDVRVGSPEDKKMPDLQGNPQQAIYIAPPFWAPILFWFEQWGLTWLCCLIPLLLLLLLLWLLFRKRKQSVGIGTAHPDYSKKASPENEPGFKMGKNN